MRHTLFIFLCGTFLFLGCNTHRKAYTILGNIEDPQNEIANTIATILNAKLHDSVKVIRGSGSMMNLELLEQGKADLAILDNYSKYSDKVSSIFPLYPQVLHILYRKGSVTPKSLKELFLNGKVFPGVKESGTQIFVEQLITDLNIDRSKIQFVDILDFFDADVIFSFTDLLTMEELRDLSTYELYSIDDVNKLGKGSLAESICTRHPQFEPFIIPNDLYGGFTTAPILTIKIDAILACRTDLDKDFVYSLISTLTENSQALKNINPLLFNVSADFDPRRLNFNIHIGSKDFLERYNPSFFEKYADVFSAIVTVIVAFASSFYTFSQWQKSRKKNKIDAYYKELLAFRARIVPMETAEELNSLQKALKQLQEETINLVVREKLLADESFSIFLNLSKIVMEEIQSRKQEIKSVLGS